MKTLSLARKELAGYFFSPLAYVVGALFLCACALKFAPPPALWTGSRDFFILVPGRSASLRPLFEMMAKAMIVVGPLLTMRLLSDEFRSGTIETLLTAPITDTQVVLGKFLGVLGFYLALLAGTGVFLVLMCVFAQVDPGVVAMGYLGMVLLGAAFLAVGLFASTLSRYQLLAAMVAIVLLSLVGLGAGPLTMHTPEPLNRIVANFDAMRFLSQFARGQFDTRGLTYFLSMTGGFLFLSVKTLESRRWR